MSLLILPEVCINCGACEYVCPSEAIHRPEPDAPHPAVFWISSNRCGDCGDCAPMCPLDCILTDPDSVICRERGCPLRSDRDAPFAGWDCSLMIDLCPACGHTLWRADTSMPWSCVRCDDASPVRCPKIVGYEKGHVGQRPPKRTPEELYAARAAR
ncbi:MAG: 4Fe-4S binding protein [Acidimicrobiia bacterium]